MDQSKRRIVGAGLGALALLALLYFFRSRPPEPAVVPPPAPEKPVSVAPPERPVPPPTNPTPPAETAADRQKRFEDLHKKDPPAPAKDDRIRWVGPLSVVLHIPAVPAPGSGPNGDPAIYVSQLPIPVEFWIARVPQQELPPVPMRTESWKAGLVVRIARESEEKTFLPCVLEIQEVRRGIGSERLDGIAAPIEFPEAGLSVRGTVQPGEGFRSPGKYVLRAELDVNALVGVAGKWEVQTSPRTALRLLQENSSNDRLNVLAAQVPVHIQKGEYDQAIEACQTLLRERPNSIAAHHDLATALWKKGQDLPRAIDMMERAIQNLERGTDPDPDYQNLEKRVKSQMLGNMKGWVAARRGELPDKK